MKVAVRSARADLTRSKESFSNVGAEASTTSQYKGSALIRSLA